MHRAQSMIAPLRKVILKGPKEAFVDQRSIDQQWKELGYLAPPDLKKACSEHAAFAQLLEKAGAELLYLPADERTGLDSIYTHDPAISTDSGVIICLTGKDARRGEGPAMADALEKWGVPVIGKIYGTGCVEGGDCLWLDSSTLLVGRGFRTNAEGITQLRSILRQKDIFVVSFPLPYWNGPGDVLHLMSLISLVDSNLAVVYRKLIPVPLYELLAERGVQLIDVTDEEFPTLASNVLAVAPREVVLASGNPVTEERLRDAGCGVQTFEAQEIGLKACGGPTCLTRPVWRG